MRCLNLGADGDEMVDALRGGVIPAFVQPGDDLRGKPDAAAKVLAVEVGVQIPDIARRGEAVTDMQRVRPDFQRRDKIRFCCSAPRHNPTD